MVLLLFLCTVACKDRRPPAPTAEQSAQLNEAEDMLNGAGNEEGPADQGPHQSTTLTGTHSTGPSNQSD
jgi:hypothetical protein